MKCRSLLPVLILFSANFLAAQQPARIAYAITGGQKGQSNWTEIKLIDLNTGSVLRTIYENGRQSPVFNARTGRPLFNINTKTSAIDDPNLPFSTFSAACAYDRKHNRLYYTPMGINQLRFIDLNERDPRFFYFEGEAFGKVTGLQDESNQITRMVIGADGSGYALTNDGNHLIRFTTGKRPVITDLGNMVDDNANGMVSIHNKCSSWGGDMVADAFGKLYLISARQAVFIIDPDSRLASFKGFINGLPSSYTTNGAVVGDDGNIVVSSANAVNGYYVVDLHSLKASAIPARDQVYNTSDLANGNLALQKEHDNAISEARVGRRELIRNNNITVYPNPVIEGSFRFYFTNMQQGKYVAQLLDLTGRVMSQRAMFIAYTTQVEEMRVGDQLSKGIYLVKVIDAKQKALFADRIFLQ